METIISIKINNLIRNYPSNFLSYLYLKNGWKRTIFDMGKEIFIPINDNNIRIVITNTGSILLTCYNVSDILICLNFIISEFEYGSLSYIIHNDDDIETIKNFQTSILLDDEFNIDSEELKYDYGTISISNSVAILKYNSFEDGDRLISTVKDIYFNNSFDDEIYDEIADFDDYSKRLIIYSLFFLSFIKIVEYI